MSDKLGRIILHCFFAISAVSIGSVANAADPLTSWNDGPAKKAILNKWGQSKNY